jgi:hypothetical protein
MGIVEANDVRDELVHYIKTGGKQRFYLGHTELDKHYGIREASRTDWTGYPGSGKTELLIECLWNCSNYYDHKHLINMPDAGSKLEVIAKLFHKITGKHLERYFWTKDGRQEADSVANEKDIDRHLPEILHFFKIFDSKGLVTPSQFWQYAVDNKKKLGIFSAAIDSWNYMHQDLEGLREDKWLAKTLQFGNDLVEESGLHFHTVIHPKSARIKDGKLQPPTYHEMKGGSEWGNYAKSVIVVHWEKGAVESEIHIEKAKGANVGIKGMVLMAYDIKKGRYFRQEILNNVWIKHYAAPNGEVNTNQTKMDAIKTAAWINEDDGLPF